MDPGVTIGRYCKLGDDDVVLGPQVVVYDHCVLGNRVIIHWQLRDRRRRFRLPHGQRTARQGAANWHRRDRRRCRNRRARRLIGPLSGRLGSAARTKIDNQVQIAHNCQIGRCNLIAALSGIAGSVTTGDYVIMGGQVGIADHSHVGDRTMLGLPEERHSWRRAGRSEDARRARRLGHPINCES